MMMSKRYLKGGLLSSFSLIFGFSIRAVNMSAVGFQKSLMAQFKLLFII